MHDRLIKLAMIAIAVVLSLVIISCVPKDYNVKIWQKPSIYPVIGYVYTTALETIVEINGKLFVVPINFETDLASIPRPFWSIYSPRKAMFVTAAILHDYMYQCRSEYRRYEIDSIFYRFLRKEGASDATAYKFYLCVRFFGLSHYKPVDCSNVIGKYV